MVPNTKTRGHRAQTGAQGVLYRHEEDLCAVRVAETWHSYPQVVGESPCLEASKHTCTICVQLLLQLQGD